MVVVFPNFAQMQAVTGGSRPQKQLRLLSVVSHGIYPCSKERLGVLHKCS